MNQIRRIEARDRAAVLELLAGTGAFQAHELDVAMELVDTALTKPAQQDYHPFVLDEGGAIVAYACFGRNPMTKSTFDLYWIATLKRKMKMGYGRRIVEFVEVEVRRQGGRLLIIETSSQASYEGSREFYTRVGYALAAQLPDFYDVGDDKLIYLKKLAS